MSYVYGVILVIVGSIGNNLGNNLVSLGHKEHNIKCSNSKAPVHDFTMTTDLTELNTSIMAEHKDDSFFTWCNVGRIVFVLGSLFTFASFAFGAQSLIASLESVQFVSNVVFVHYVHHEPITKRMLLATLSIVVGNVLVVIFAEHAAQKFTSDDMIYLYKTNNVYHGYMVLAFILWAVTSYTYSTYHDSRMNKRVLMWNHSFMEPFCYAVSASVVGTQAVLNSKCLALLLEATTSGAKNEFMFWYFYFVLGTWLLLVAYWLTRLDAGLALFPPCFIIPVMQVFFVFFAIICGGIYFQEFVHFKLSQYIGFIAGVLMILGGVYGLAPLDMRLHVPGDPLAPDPTKICSPCGTATVHPEIALPKGEDDTDLDQMFDGELTKKPQPNGEDVNLYSKRSADANENSDAASMFDQSQFTRASKSPAKGTRKVVKRPPLELQSLQLPPVSTRGVNGLGLSTEAATPGVNDSPTDSSALLEGSKGSQKPVVPAVTEEVVPSPQTQSQAPSSRESPRLEVPTLQNASLPALSCEVV